MRIDEAIKLQAELKSLLPEVGFNKYTASTQLAIEALKMVKDARFDTSSWTPHLLPGETEV